MLALSHSRLQERLTISQDLHDSLGGSLVRSIALVEQTSTPPAPTNRCCQLSAHADDLRQLIDAGTSATIQVPETTDAMACTARRRCAPV